MENRLIQLLEALVDNPNHILDIDSFSKICNVTTRTVYNDINKLRNLCQNNSVKTCKVSILKNKKVRLQGSIRDIQNLKNRVLFELIYKNYEDNPEVREKEILISLLLDLEKNSINKLAQKYFVSRTSIVLTLDKIEKSLPKNLILKRDHTGTHIVGNNEDKRKLATKIIYNMVSCLPEQENDLTIIQKIFSSVDVKSLVDIVDEVLSKRNLLFSYDVKIGIVVHLCVMCFGDFNYEEDDTNVQPEIKEFSDLLSLLLRERLGINIENNKFRYLNRYLSDVGINALHITAEKRAVDSEVRQFVDKLLNELHSIFLFNFSEDDDFMAHLLWHCTSMFSRLRHGRQLHIGIAKEIKESFLPTFNIISFIIFDLLPNDYQNVSAEEVALLAVYIQSALEKRNELKKVCVVCHEGLVFSEFISAKLTNFFPEIEITKTLSIEEAKRELKGNKEVDCVISTQFFETDLPLLVVSPLLSLEDVRYIKMEISSNKSALNKVITSDDIVFLPLNNVKEKEEILFNICNYLEKNNYVGNDFINTVIDREQQLSTALPSKIALPHGKMDKVKHSVIAFCPLNDSVKWGGCNVTLVILLAIGKDKWKNWKQSVYQLYDVISDDNKVEKLLNAKSKVDVMKLFK